jgi:hypothetical protein
VASVDYYVGTLAGTKLKDPLTTSAKGLAIDTTNHLIRVTENNVKLDGYDFSLQGGYGVYISTGISDTVVTDSKFLVGANNVEPIAAKADAGGLTDMYNTIDGGSHTANGNSDSVWAFINFNMSGNFVAKHNLLTNALGDAIDFSKGAIEPIIEYNLVTSLGHAPGSYPNFVQFVGSIANNSVAPSTRKVGSPVALGKLALTDLGGSNDTVQSLINDGIPCDALLTDGLNSFTASLNGGMVDVTDWDVLDLSITLPDADDFTLTAVATTQDSQRDVASASVNEVVTVTPAAATLSVVTSAGVATTTQSSSTPAYNDGSANAPAGTPQLPSLLAGYAVLPPWEVAGVNYAVGVPAGTTLQNPTAISMAGAGADTATHIVFVTGNNVTLSGYDFGLAGGWQIYIEPGATNTVIENSNFLAGSNNLVPINAGSGVGNLTVQYNTFNGGSSSTAVWALVNYNGSGTFVAEYNSFLNSVEDAIDFSAGTMTTIVKYNVFYKLGTDPGAHADSVQYNGVTSTNSVIAFNTIYEPNASGMQGIQVSAQNGGSIINTTVENNVVVAKGPALTMSYSIAVAVTSGAVVDDNYIDFSGAYGPFYPPSGSNLTFSGNVNMTTGAQIAAPAGTTTSNLVQVVAVPPAATAGPGSEITLVVRLNETAVVSGLPALTLNTGGVATFRGGSGTDTLMFSYTVAKTDRTVPALAISGLNLPPGSFVRDRAGNNLNFSGISRDFPDLAVNMGSHGRARE